MIGIVREDCSVTSFSTFQTETFLTFQENFFLLCIVNNRNFYFEKNIIL